MIENSEILRRRDMRDVFTFTVDPTDAKDFDDALSFESLSVDEIDDLTAKRSNSDNGLTASAVIQALPVYRIGVHIADVSFYVKPGTKIDDEAYKKGTSTYLVDRVIPMLPEELCNDKCSLRPGEDKLCMSVIFTMDASARVIKYKVCRTVIRSDARLNYDEVQQIIAAFAQGNTPNQTGETWRSQLTFGFEKGRQTGSLSRPRTRENRVGGKLGASTMQVEAIKVLNNLAAKLRAERIANGALTIEQDEMHFHLDNHGHPTDIYFEQPNEAHHLIEEFMLLANRTIAKSVGSGRPFVYRVHDIPNADKLDEVKQFKRKMGSRVSQQTIDLLTIRAQAKAVYSTYNIGHYGLAFTHYTHFTSPIRRYPDLMVHRLVDKYCLSAKRSFSETVLQRSGLTAQAVARENLELMCEHCSACEQEAAQAERDSVKLFQAIWMNDHIGEILAGHISGVSDFGLFVQLDQSRCEGLIHISKIGFPGETWIYDEKNYRLVCAENRISHTLGDAVRVKVVGADVNRAQIDFVFA